MEVWPERATGPALRTIPRGRGLRSDSPLPRLRMKARVVPGEYVELNRRWPGEGVCSGSCFWLRASQGASAGRQ